MSETPSLTPETAFCERNSNRRSLSLPSVVGENGNSKRCRSKRSTRARVESEACNFPNGHPQCIFKTKRSAERSFENALLGNRMEWKLEAIVQNATCNKMNVSVGRGKSLRSTFGSTAETGSYGPSAPQTPPNATPKSEKQML